MPSERQIRWMDPVAPAPRIPPTIADRLTTALAGRYAIERELGAGGMATVFEARDLRHHRRVAVKVLKPELAALLGSERFLDEIQVTAHLQHPHILPLFDSGEADGLIFYVMPLVEGESLRQRLAREKELPVNDAVRIASEIADALDCAHSHGVIHRDIKPENVLLQNGRVLVADFGIALAVRQSGGSRLTEAGASLGTPEYMSPEQATGDRVPDGRSDLYSLACVTYEMLTGQPPHSAPTFQGVLAAIVTTEPRPLGDLRSTVPRHVSRAVHRALQKLPADRFETVLDFAGALAQPASTVELERHLAPGGRRRAALWAPWLLTLPALALVALVLLNRPKSSVPPFTISALAPPEDNEFDAQASLALSPSGRQLAFRAVTEGGRARLWLRSLDTLHPRLLAGTDGADWPFWSPDGNSIGYFTNGQLLRHDLKDATNHQLCSASGPRGGSWSPSGTIVFAAKGGLWKVSAAGGPCSLLIGSDTSALLRPSFLPDGRHFVFSRVRPEAIMLGDLRTSAARILATGYLDAQFAAPDLLVYAHPPSATLIARRMDLSQLSLVGEPTTIASSVRGQANVFSFSVSGGLLAYLEQHPDLPPLEVDRTGTLRAVPLDRPGLVWSYTSARQHPWLFLGSDSTGLWLHDRASGTTTRLGTRLAAWPVVGPRDQRIAYFSLGWGGSCTISVHDLSRAQDTTLGTRRCFHPTDWSSDGRYLLLSGFIPWLSASGSLDTVWSYSLPDGSIVPRVAKEANVRDGVLSPDGRWIAYASDETGAFEVYLQPFSGKAGQVLVSRSGGRWPRWTGDGRALYFLSPNGDVVSAAVAAGSTGISVTAPRVLFRYSRWSRSLYSEVAPVFEMTPDGERFFLRRPTSEPVVTLVENWALRLKRP
jgi:eukaryotic-like serine/threonine-protein kinase